MNMPLRPPAVEGLERAQQGVFLGSGEMRARCRALDWSATPLGLVASWPSCLRVLVDAVLANPFPALLLWGSELTQIYNDSYCVLMGGRHPAGLGQATSLCWPETWHVKQSLYTRVRGGESVTFEQAPATGGLEDAWFTLSYSPLRDESGVVAGVQVTAFDATARVRAESAQRESEAQLALIFERAMVGLSEINPDGRFVRANPELARIVGRTPDELRLATVADVTHPDDVEASLKAARSVLESGIPETLEKRYRRPDGTAVWAQSSVTRLDGSAFRGPRLLAVTVDLSARRQIELERAHVLEREQAARAEAEHAVRLQDEFLAMISHELRTPLNAILGWSSVLRASSFTAEQAARALETIERNARTQVRLVEDLLDIGRVASGKLRLNVAPLDLLAVVCAGLEVVRPAALGRNVRLVPSLPADPVRVSGDADRLQQVVWNLLSNAVKFTGSGGEVRVRVEREGPEAVLVVGDSGQGIEPSFLPHVFDRFRQAEGGITRAQGGLGLGLAIAKNVVELHGGTIAVASEGVGRGATFTVRLPAPSGASVAVLASEPRLPATPPALDELACPSQLRGARVLIVEDDADTRELLVTVLARCGVLVEVAADARDGLVRFEANPPDVLLTDVDLPGEDGYSLLGKVRALPREAGGTTPAVALTAYARAQDRAQALRAGFTTHLPKPVRPSELLAVLASAVARRDRASPAKKG